LMAVAAATSFAGFPEAEGGRSVKREQILVGAPKLRHSPKLTHPYSPKMTQAF